MNKEDLTRELEYTEKNHRQDTVNTFDTDISMMCADVLRVLKNCIEIPNNATNGDMIKALFPNISVYEHGATYSINNEYNFNSTWWNSPYRKEN